MAEWDRKWAVAVLSACAVLALTPFIWMYPPRGYGLPPFSAFNFLLSARR